MPQMTWHFDLDDTLIDQDQSFRNALMKFMADQFGVESNAKVNQWVMISNDLRSQGIKGLDLFLRCLHLTLQAQPADKDQLREWQQSLLAHYKTSWVLHPDALRFISRPDIQLGVLITNGGGSREYQMSRVTSLGLQTKFHGLFLPLDGYAPKPSAEMFLEGMAVMGSDPMESVFVGDLPIDYHGANAAGMNVVLVDRGIEELHPKMPQVKSMDEIPSKFPQWF